MFTYLSYLWKQIEHFASRLLIAERKTQKPLSQCLADPETHPTVPSNAMQWFSGDGCLKIATVGNKKSWDGRWWTWSRCKTIEKRKPKTPQPPLKKNYQCIVVIFDHHSFYLSRAPCGAIKNWGTIAQGARLCIKCSAFSSCRSLCWIGLVNPQCFHSDSPTVRLNRD